MSVVPAVVARGRIVALGAGRFTLQTERARLDVAWPATVPLGAFAEIRGAQAGEVVSASDVRVVTAGNERFARADSDFTFLSGKRLNNLRLRQRALRAIRVFFDAQELLEVETPAIVPCPGLDVQLDAIEVLGMGAPRWLHTSPEYQMKRLLSAGVSGCYQIGKAYRRGERGRLHEPEFTMLEWYRSFAGDESMMQDTEALVAHVARQVTGGTRLPGVQHEVDVGAPWERITVADAFDRYAGVSLEAIGHDDDRFYRLLIEKVEPELGRGRPTFLTRYPARMASLARVCADDPRYAERFEAYVDGIELCNGFGELTDPAEQQKRFEADRAQRKKLGRSVYPVDERLMASLADGVPPSGGNALGVDRLIMLIAGAKQIDEVIAFGSTRV